MGDVVGTKQVTMWVVDAISAECTLTDVTEVTYQSVVFPDSTYVIHYSIPDNNSIHADYIAHSKGEALEKAAQWVRKCMERDLVRYQAIMTQLADMPAKLPPLPPCEKRSEGFDGQPEILRAWLLGDILDA